MSELKDLPVAIVGGGPVGLAAAAELASRRVAFRLFEAGATVADSVRDWGHVRLFSPWRYNVADAAARLLDRSGWRAPDADGLPTGAELYDRYLKPLAELPELAGSIETATRVVAIGRSGIDKVISKDRAARPFVLSTIAADGSPRTVLAGAVIDASGTWRSPNPLGASGSPAQGEAAAAGAIAYGIPDVLGRDRATYAGRTTLVAGSGHSAANVILDLVRLRQSDPLTDIIWATRTGRLPRLFGGAEADELPARGALGSALKGLVERGEVAHVAGFSASSVRTAGDSVLVEGEIGGEHRVIGPVDRIIVATGQRPDLTLTRELRLELDPWLESARALGPMIDPNLHSCGTVPPHGHRELSHPEPDFYTIGVKSYGRAPTFLLATGHEQARSVVAAIAGDLAAADDLRLVLPETGVCSAPSGEGAAAGCCGGPAAEAVDACCVADATAKAAGKDGCGCRAAA